MYVARLDGDANWQAYGPATKNSGNGRSNGDPASKPKKAPAKKVDSPSQPPAGAAPEIHRTESAALMRFSFPLRDELDAVLSLPRDLTNGEAARLSAFLNSLAREDTAS